ncbi:MAG: hypothetical protein ACF8LL_12920, partial [Phycisphaerales bacterium]
MSQHWPPSRTLRAVSSAALILLAGSAVLQGCAANSATSRAAGEPAAYQPEGSPAPLPADQRPDPIVIDVNNRDGYVRTTIAPEIYDTRTVTPQRQLTEPFDGQVRMIKHQLYQHSRDKSLENIPDNQRTMPVGQAVEMDRVNHAGGTGFEGIAQTEWSPPDPTLAVGPDHIVETVNAAIAFYDKDTGNETFSVHLGTPGAPGFFEPVGADSNFVFDPKVFYDHKAERFVVIALETSGASWIDIAVSDDSDPHGIWYKYRTPSVIDVGGNDYWVDYPGFGFDDNAWYVTGNLFPLGAGSFGGQLFRVYPKGPMLNGDPVTFSDLAPDNGASLQVAQMFGPAPQCYFVSRRNSSSLRVWTINDPINNPSWQRVTVDQLSNASGPSQDANNNGGEISTLDGRIMNVHYRDGNLYAGHAIDGPPGQTVARWYHIDINGWPGSGNSPFLVQQGEITGNNGRHYFFPAIYSDKDHNVGLITSSSSPSDFASVRISGRFPSDPLGTMSEPVEVAIGDNVANGRWGDYLDIAIDPEDDKTFWIIGMYQRSFGWQ